MSSRPVLVSRLARALALLAIALAAGAATAHEMSMAEMEVRELSKGQFLWAWGLGFAGALKEVGLPQSHLAIPLLTFNAGVEIGQLMAVLTAYVLTCALGRVPGFAAARTPALYAIGIVAAYWSWLRIGAIG